MLFYFITLSIFLIYEIYFSKKDLLTISVQGLIFFKVLSMSIYTFFPPTLPCPVRPLEGLDGNLL